MAKKRNQKTLTTQLLDCINSGREVGGFWDHEVVRSARKAKGLTLQELAKKVGCTQGFLSLYENGKKSPAPYLLERILQALDLGVMQILGDQVVPSGASKRTQKRIENDNANRKKRSDEMEIARQLARVRMLSAVVLTALREKGYEAVASISNQPVCVKVAVQNGPERQFTILVQENEQ